MGHDSAGAIPGMLLGESRLAMALTSSGWRAATEMTTCPPML